MCVELKQKHPPNNSRVFLLRNGSPTETRTPVSTLKGWCPRPLDDGAVLCDVVRVLLSTGRFRH